MRPVIALAVLLATAPALAADAKGPAPAPMPVPPLPGKPLPPSVTFTGKKFPPPGSPADQALLGELLEAQGAMLSQRAWAITATQRLSDGGYDGRLATLQAAQAPGVAEGTGRLRARLTAAWNEVAGIMTAKWPVDGRLGCRQQAVNFEVLMAPGAAQASEHFSSARDSARRCLERQRLVLGPLEKANRDLDSAWREAQALLAGPGGSGAGAAAAPAGGSK